MGLQLFQKMISWRCLNEIRVQFDDREVKMKNSTSIIKDKEYVIVDIETTGFSLELCSIIEIAALKISSGEIVDKFHAFIKQTKSIPPFITNLTGITDGEVANGELIEDVLLIFLKFTGNLALVGHNITFDYRFLNFNLQKHLNLHLFNKYIDTLKLAKELIYDVPNYKLDTLVKYFNINDEGHHRADKDVFMTYELIKSFSNLNDNYRENNNEQINKSVKNCSKFCNKRITIKAKTKYVNTRLLECIFNDVGSKVEYTLHSESNVLIVEDQIYQIFLKQDSFDEMFESWLNKAKHLFDEGKLEIYSEKQICELLNIEIVEKTRFKPWMKITAKEVVATIEEFDEKHPLYKKKCVFTGALVKCDRKSAMQHVVNAGGICQDSVTKTTDYLILGDNDHNVLVKNGISTKQKKAEQMIKEGFGIKIISESTFYEMIKNN